MDSSILFQVVMPLVIITVMFGMGLELKPADFSVLLRQPKPILAGIIGQILFLPAIAFTTAIMLGLSPTFAVGLALIGACPGATTSNIFSQLSRANLALSISLTATSAVLCTITAPLIASLALRHFVGTDVEFSVVRASMSVFLVTLVPVLVGMAVRHKWPSLTRKVEASFRRISGAAVLLFVIALYIREQDSILSQFAELAPATFILNWSTILVGLLLAFWFRLSTLNRLTLGIEVGVQNAALAIFIGINVIGDVTYTYPALVYSVTMYIGVITFIYLHKKFFPTAEVDSGNPE